MFKEMIILQSAGIFQSGILGELLSKWQEAGFFSYLLPFLLIFALVFGILTRTNIFKDNKVVNGIIALAVALMALQFNFVPQFFTEIFPRVGVGLAIILAILIVAGLFIDPKSNAINYILLGIAVVTVGAIIIQSAGAVGWASGQWWQDHWAIVAGGIFLIIVIAVVVGTAGKKDGKAAPILNPYYTKE